MDEQRLREMLSAWFDGELSPQEMKLVEAYIERSEEARQIVAGLEALKKLSDESVLNPQSDYWERSAARIEATLGDVPRTKITPVKRSAWSEWGVKAISLAASVVLLTYLGFHSEEILDQMWAEPPVKTSTREIVDGEKSSQIIDQDSAAQELKEETEPVSVGQPEAQSLLPKPVAEEARQKLEPSAELGLETPPKAVTIDQEVEQTYEAALESGEVLKIAIPKPPGRSDVSLSDRTRTQSESLNAPALAPVPIADSVGTDLHQLTLPVDLSETLEEAGERVTAYDSTSPEASKEEQYRYLWDHVVVHKLTALRATSPKMHSSGDVNKSLSSGLQDGLGRSRKPAKKKDKRQAVDQERRLIDAAFYVGSTTESSSEYSQAIRYLEYMALENDQTLDKPYAQRKYEELEAQM